MAKIKLTIIFLFLGFLIIPFGVSAQEIIFNIDRFYDFYARKELTATLVKTTNQLYFYVDKDWWQNLDYSKRQSLDLAFYNLATEFEYKIYPNLTKTFGFEPKPGIDRDERITILIHPMISEAGGYFNSGDVYSKLQNPRSNEREMIYLNSQHIDQPEAKSFLAHEFLHLITVNQKDILRGVTEEIWLNEMRAEYGPTLLGYDDIYQGSRLEKRVKDFLNKPSDSLTEWLNKGPDYGLVNLFGQYLVDHYGLKILVDSLHSSKTGIESLNYALARNGFKEDFSQIFSDWLVALLINDCKLGPRYCYLNKNLKNLRVVPTTYYLPRSETILSTYHTTSYWSGNWHRLVGGGNNLTLEFEGTNSVEFKIPYLLCDLEDTCSVGFLTLDKEQKGKITFSNFREKYSSLTIMPFIGSKTAGFNGKEKTFSFSWKATVEEKIAPEKEGELISQLLAQIAELKRQIAEYQAKIAVLLAKKELNSLSCQRFDNNLYYGIRNDPEVRCLQEFLKSQGPEIYPEGLVTGNFLSLTKSAVIRFQEKYASEILTPLGLEQGTGFVGPLTRQKINQLLGQ